MTSANSLPDQKTTNALRELSRAEKKLKGDFYMVLKLIPGDMSEELEQVSPTPSLNHSIASTHEPPVTTSGQIQGPRPDQITSTSSMRTVWSGSGEERLSLTPD